MAYGDFKYLPSRTTPDKVLRDKAFKIASNPESDECQHRLQSVVFNLFDKAGDTTHTDSRIVFEDLIVDQ